MSVKNSIIELPFECPLAIGAPGVSHAERLYRGMATILVAQHKKHQFLCKKWSELGCCLDTKADPYKIGPLMRRLIADDYSLARALSARGQEVIDGKGAARIAHFTGIIMDFG